MLPEDTIEPRATTGVHARAVAPPSPPAPAAAPDPITEGLARALRHMTAANVAAADLAADLDGAFLGGPGAPETHRRATALVRIVQRELAGAIRDLTDLPTGT